MNKPKNIKPFNAKGQAHGYWKAYWGDGSIMHEGNYINDRLVGLWFINWNGKPVKCYYI